MTTPPPPLPRLTQRLNQNFSALPPKLVWRSRFSKVWSTLVTALKRRNSPSPIFKNGSFNEEIVNLSLKDEFTFIHEPFQQSSKFPYLGRTNEVQELAQRILFSSGGVILVTGYRGVGKTSFVNRSLLLVREIIPKFHRQLGYKDLLHIQFNLAREMGPDEIMHHIVRRTHQALIDHGVMRKLGKDTRKLINLAYQRTSITISKKTGTTQSAQLGVSFPDLAGLGAKSPFSLSRNFGKSNEEQMSFLGYDDQAAEFDVIQILRRLTTKSSKRFSKRNPLKVVIVFDELDKINPYVIENGQRIVNPYMDRLLSALKTVLTASNVVFIFIASREFHERWQADLRRSDSIFDSIFAHQMYLDCQWDFPGILLDTYRSTRNAASEPIENLLAGYLRFQSRGIVRRAYRTLNSLVRWHNDGLQIIIDRTRLEQIKFYDQLDQLLHTHISQILSPIRNAANQKPRVDEYCNYSYRLAELIIETAGKPFTLNELLKVGQEEIPLITTYELTDLTNIVLDVLVSGNYVDYVYKQKSGFARILNEVPISKSKSEIQYRLADWVLIRLNNAEPIEGEENGSATIRILGNYDLIRRLGEGGFSEIFLAYDRQKNSKVVIKVARENSDSSEISASEILASEGRLLENLDIPELVRLFKNETTIAPSYLVLEYIAGVDLGQAIRLFKSGFGADLTLTLVHALAKPVIALQEQEIIQLDLKPANFMITRSGDIRLVDIGSAIDERVKDVNVTQSPKPRIGTPEYAAPELKQPSGELSYAVDVYSFGILVYEVLTGSLPTPAVLAELRQHDLVENPNDARKKQKTARATQQLDDMQEPVRRAIARALVETPTERFSTVSEFLEALPSPSASLKTIADMIFSQVDNLEAELRSGTQALIADIAPYTPHSKPSSPLDNSTGTLASAPLTGSSRPSFSPPPYPQPAPSYYPSPSINPEKTGQLGEQIEQQMVLVGLTAPFQNDIFKIVDNRVRIGRLPDNEIVMSDDSISRIHALLEHKGSGEWYLSDLGSSTGTYVNKRRVSTPEQIRPSDTITVGRFEFRFDISEAIAAQSQILSTSNKLGRYTIIRKIGQGGMSSVYEARDVAITNRLVAIKEFRFNNFSRQEDVQEAQNLAQQEARLLAQLEHPNIVKIYDYFNEAGSFYIIMEFLSGPSLLEVLEQHPKGLPEDRVLNWAKQLCDALQYLHTRQPPIIFRDLKPANIILLSDEKLKLIDFGIARFYKRNKSRDTGILGTPGFAAPEQYGTHQTSVSADVYSLGVTLHSLLTGHDPTQTPFRLPLAHTVNPKVSKHVSDVLEVATRHQITERYQSTAEFWMQLSRRQTHRLTKANSSIETSFKRFWERIRG